MRLIKQRGLTITQLLRITHLSGGQPHYLALIGDGRYICDCCMGINLGIPCRHYFQALMTVPGLQFSIALVRARYCSIVLSIVRGPQYFVQMVPESKT